MAGEKFRSLISSLFILLIFNCIACSSDQPYRKKGSATPGLSDSGKGSGKPDAYQPVSTILVLPKNPGPGETFRILITGEENIRKAKISVDGPSGSQESIKGKSGEEMPYWRIDDFTGSPAGKYKATLLIDKKVAGNLEFEISERTTTSSSGVVWKTLRGWDSGKEAIYSAWINALFQGCSEDDSWSALHEVTQESN